MPSPPKAHESVHLFSPLLVKREGDISASRIIAMIGSSVSSLGASKGKEIGMGAGDNVVRKVSRRLASSRAPVMPPNCARRDNPPAFVPPLKRQCDTTSPSLSSPVDNSYHFAIFSEIQSFLND